MYSSYVWDLNWLLCWKVCCSGWWWSHHWDMHLEILTQCDMDLWADCAWIPCRTQREDGWQPLPLSFTGKQLTCFTVFYFCALRTSIRTLELCCLNSMDCTVCRQVARTYELWWWTIFYHGQSRCISNMTSRAQHTNDGLLRKSERRFSPPIKTWTFYKTSLMVFFWMLTCTMLFVRPCSVTVWWVCYIYLSLRHWKISVTKTAWFFEGLWLWLSDRALN